MSPTQNVGLISLTPSREETAPAQHLTVQYGQVARVLCLIHRHSLPAWAAPSDFGPVSAMHVTEEIVSHVS